jgi:rhodanese-related sulfurtransferase
MQVLPAARNAFSLLIYLLVAFNISAQYKNDNVAFKTVYMEEFCKQFKSNPKAILLDVRSQGEFDDTSSSVSLNIGRVKSATHIDIQELPARWRELNQYKDQPVYVLCSHSQRSRRASKMLADSGFTNIINVNGGLTTFNLLNMQHKCNDLYETHNDYKLISPLDVCSFLDNEKNVFIIDVRTDSAFNGIALDERQNAYGKFKGSANIPTDQLNASLSKIPKDRPLLVVSDFGAPSVGAARFLTRNGYKQVNVLFNGLDALISADKKIFPALVNIGNNILHIKWSPQLNLINWQNKTKPAIG